MTEVKARIVESGEVFWSEWFIRVVANQIAKLAIKTDQTKHVLPEMLKKFPDILLMARSMSPEAFDKHLENLAEALKTIEK